MLNGIETVLYLWHMCSIRLVGSESRSIPWETTMIMLLPALWATHTSFQVECLLNIRHDAENRVSLHAFLTVVLLEEVQSFSPLKIMGWIL